MLRRRVVAAAALAVAFLCLAPTLQPAPLVYSASGCAAGCTGAEQDETADSFVFPFNARELLVINDETAGGDSLWIRVDEGTAVASGGDDKSWEVKAAEGMSFPFRFNQGPRSVSLVTASGTTAAYRLVVYR